MSHGVGGIEVPEKGNFGSIRRKIRLHMRISSNNDIDFTEINGEININSSNNTILLVDSTDYINEPFK